MRYGTTLRHCYDFFTALILDDIAMTSVLLYNIVTTSLLLQFCIGEGCDTKSLYFGMLLLLKFRSTGGSLLQRNEAERAHLLKVIGPAENPRGPQRGT